MRLDVFISVLVIGIILLVSTVSATQITLNNIAVEKGNKATVSIILDQVPADGLAGYTINLKIADPSKARISAVTFNSELGGLTDSTTVPFTIGSVSWVDTGCLIDYGDSGTNLVLATITVYGVDSGSTTLETSILELTGDDSDGLDCSATTGIGCEYPDHTSSSTISSPTIIVSSSSAPAQIPVSLTGYPSPKDPDSDGLYEDLDGDGLFNFNDISLYFYNFDWIQKNEPVTLFDFDGNGKIDFGDIISLNQKR